MEQLDLINEQDEIIGKTTRERVNNEGLLYRCAGVFVFKENKLILQQRSKTKKIRPQNWSIVEETVKSGETFTEAAIRGVKEELGVTITDINLFLKKTIRDNLYNDNFIMQFYTAKTSEEPKIDYNELEKIEFFSLKETQKLVQKNTKITPSLKESINSLIKST